MSKWSDFYVSRINNKDYEAKFEAKYKPFLDLLMGLRGSYPLKDEVFLEAGAGIGTTTKYLINQGATQEHLLIDACDVQVNNAYTNLSCFDDDGVNIVIVKQDLLERGHNWYSTIIHSHGLLEHFEDADIRSILDNLHSSQRNHTNHIRSIHYVPSNKYKEPSFGDERLLSPSEWNRICKPTDIVEFNNGLDLALIFD